MSQMLILLDFFSFFFSFFNVMFCSNKVRWYILTHSIPYLITFTVFIKKLAEKKSISNIHRGFKMSLKIKRKKN